MSKTENNWVISSILEKKEDLNLDRFWEVYNIIQENSYGIWEIEKQELIDWAIKWLVGWLSDKHSEYMNSEEKEQFNELLTGDFEGIGAIVEEHPLWVLIEQVFKWSPALEYWVKAKDIVIKANGIELQDINLFEAISHIKWPAGTKVELEILREWENKVLTIEVIRDKITIPSVDSELLENNIWYITLNMFGDDTVDEFKKALNSLSNTDGLIIDLRDNWGWYLHAATEILSELLENNTLLVTVKYSNRVFNEEYKSINYWDIYKKPIVVLINENSASASEIVSWALHDYKKAILVWKQSYGKWSVQQPFWVDNDSLLKITIAKWFTPNDKNIDKEWITPDIEVDFEEEDYENRYDRQFEVAKEVIETFIQSNSIDFTVDKFTQTWSITQ
jgi:carboxyl-terminal processing protease